MVLLLVLILLLIWPTISHAKGGSSRQVDAVGPKSEELKALENQFYSMMNPLISAYTMPLDGGGTATGQQSATQTASAGKGGSSATNTMPKTEPIWEYDGDHRRMVGQRVVPGSSHALS